MAIPANISTGRVTGQFVVGVVDGADTDDEPDFIAAKGYISFTASTPYLPNRTAAPNPVTMLNTTIRAVLDDEGYLCTPNPQSPSIPGKRGIRLVATNDPDTGVEGWTWNATPSFTDVNGARLTDAIKTFDFALPSGSTVDLTTVVRVPASQGIGVPQAEAAAAAAQAAAVKAAADAKAAAADAKAAAGAAKATDSNVSDLVGTDGTETNAAVARQVETAVAPKLDTEEALKVFQSAASLDAAAAAKVKTANSALREAVDARAQAAASTKLDSGQAFDAFATKDQLDDSVQATTARQVPPLVAQAIAADGTITEAAITAVSGAVEGLDLVAGSDTRIPQVLPDKAGWAHLEVDEQGVILSGVRTNGTTYFRDVESPGLLASSDPRLPQPLPEIALWDHVELDANNNVISGRKVDGTYYFRKLDSPATGELPNKVAGFGDSMLGDHGGLGVTTLTAMAAELGVEVYFGGVPGQTSTEIALRQGGLDVLLTVGGNAIPASGTVSVTVTQPSGTWKTGSAWNFTGSLAGVEGVLNKSTTDAWTFTRSQPGSVVSVKPETLWYATDGRARRDWVQIFRGGRNNVQAGIIARDEKAFRSGLAGNNNRFIILPTFNATTEPSGSTGYNNIMAINAVRAETYGPNYYDMRGWLIRNGLAEAGITPTADDVTAIAEDRIPPSLLHDAVHLNAVGRTIEGKRLAYILKSKGMIA